MCESIQDIARIKKELRELDLKIAESTGQTNGLRAAKETLEQRTENSVPGAFPSTESGGVPGRRQLLMPAMRSRLGKCERSLHDLNERCRAMTAELDVLQQRIMDALGEAAVVSG
jgi:phage shock protein A